MNKAVILIAAAALLLGATGTRAAQTRGAVHLYFFALAVVPSAAPSASPADWRPAAMREFFTWALDTAYQMSAPGPYNGPNHSPDVVQRVIGGCDPQTRDNPLRIDLLCGSAPDGVFTNQADFLAIANSSMPAGFAKTVCPKASSLPDYLAGEVFLECLRNSNGTEIDLERNTDPRIKGLFGISVVMLPHT
jgi:hypothetical protein